MPRHQELQHSHYSITHTIPIQQMRYINDNVSIKSSSQEQWNKVREIVGVPEAEYQMKSARYNHTHNRMAGIVDAGSKPKNKIIITAEEFISNPQKYTYES